MLDLKIVGGTIVDGTGKPGFAGDVGVRDGRIVAVGQVTEDAHETIDAKGRVVAPGFVDCHTHYDAQVFWDPRLSPSCFHGVTTVVGGFCGFSIAPLSDESAPYVRRMLARVEGMPLETLEAVSDWGWRSFGDYLARVEGRLGVNAGFFAGHSAIRRAVMGERAVGPTATTKASRSPRAGPTARNSSSSPGSSRATKAPASRCCPTCRSPRERPSSWPISRSRGSGRSIGTCW
ncbi:MAG: amidohydrolase family protein [Sphingomonadales bacterium]|nr:amidohydrolase family protein [Sphingomonadales bacterium]